jgi:hypothetical protein
MDGNDACMAACMATLVLNTCYLVWKVHKLQEEVAWWRVQYEVTRDTFNAYRVMASEKLYHTPGGNAAVDRGPDKAGEGVKD